MDMFEGVGRRLDQRTGSFLDIGQHSLNGRERNCLFRNDGDGTFTEVGWVNDADRVEDGRGLAIFDYDRDGRLDLVVRNYRQPAELLRNGGPPRPSIEVWVGGVRWTPTDATSSSRGEAPPSRPADGLREDERLPLGVTLLGRRPAPRCRCRSRPPCRPLACRARRCCRSG